VYIYVLYGSQCKQQLFPYTALIVIVKSFVLFEVRTEFLNINYTTVKVSAKVKAWGVSLKVGGGGQTQAWMPTYVRILRILQMI
jgi:hypothetical protein